MTKGAVIGMAKRKARAPDGGSSPSKVAGVNPWLEPVPPEVVDRLHALRDAGKWEELAAEWERLGLLEPRPPAPTSKLNAQSNAQFIKEKKPKRRGEDGLPLKISKHAAKDATRDALIVGYMTALLKLTPIDEPVTTDPAFYIEQIGADTVKWEVEFLVKFHHFNRLSRSRRPRDEEPSKDALRMRAQFAKTKEKQQAKKIRS